MRLTVLVPARLPKIAYSEPYGFPGRSKGGKISSFQIGVTLAELIRKSN